MNGKDDAVQRLRSSSKNSLSALEKRKSMLIGPRYWREYLEYRTGMSKVFTLKVKMTFSNYWKSFREWTLSIQVGEGLCLVWMAFGSTFILTARKEPKC